jgi:hypothetical protein
VQKILSICQEREQVCVRLSAFFTS